MSRYVGRFAPSPTGPLHFGSLVAALASYCDARAHNGTWHLRIDDLDTPRVVPGAADLIRRQLEACGLTWDGAVTWQSRHQEAYRAAFETLLRANRLYPCGCTRKELADAPRAIDGSPRYPGTCRNGLAPGKTARAWRYRTTEVIDFTDRIQGPLREDLPRDAGDFIVWRADGVAAYQLAVVVDDALIGVTHVVRGADLLGSTARQIALTRALELPLPHYAHVPVALAPNGQKLSKQNLAPMLPHDDPVRLARGLVAALAFLGQNPPVELQRARPDEIVAWAVAHWNLTLIPATLKGHCHDL
ncbi:tRNA glutamyl-Q(34) synthetase GluQRS [Hydrogenophilus islandicus]